MRSQIATISAQRSVFEAEHVIEEDLAIEIALRETVGARIEFLAVAGRLDPERIEPGVEMAAHAVGADQHQGAHRVPRRLMGLGRRDFAALGRRLGGKLGADRLLDLRPVAVECGSEVVLRRQRPMVPAPGGAFGVLADVGRSVLQAFEEFLPLAVDRAGVLLVAGIEIVDIGRVGALQKRGKGKGGVCVLARHGGVLVIFSWRMEYGAIADPGTGSAR